MKIKIKQPVALHETGQRPLNEDFIFPLHNQANPEERLFVVCDGEGGANMGEVAAKLVALSFAKYFASRPPKGAVDQAYLDGALHTAEEALTAYKETRADSKGMATTLALLHIGEEQVTLAWVGNSHLYHFDQKAQQLRSPSLEKGHSQALITGSEKPQSIMVRTLPLTELHQQDYFLLASDGISDQIDLATLEGMFKGGSERGPEQLVEELRSLTQAQSEDNYSCYLVQVEQVQRAYATGAVSDEDAAQARAAGSARPDDEPQPEGSSGNLWQNLAIAGIVVLVIAAVVLMWPKGEPNPYGDFIARGDAMMEDGQFGQAKALYDSALTYADNTQEFKNASAKRQAADARLAEATNTRGLDLPNSAEEYLMEAQEFYDNKAWASAVAAWQKAAQKLAATGGPDTLLPRPTMTQAYIYAGNDELEKEHYEQAATYYQQAVDMLDHPALANFDKDLAQMARERLQTAQANATGPRQPLADNDREAEEEAQTESESTTSTSTVASRRVAKPDGGNTEQGASAPANARVAPAQSAIDAPQLTEAQRTELNKNLATGKRLYTEAKEEDSPYLYRESAANLEAADALLDGPGAYLLAYMYHAGLGVDRDKAKALRYAQLSARKDWPAGQYYYGFLLLQRQNPRDTVTAIQSLEGAAANNFLQAIQLLQELR